MPIGPPIRSLSGPLIKSDPTAPRPASVTSITTWAAEPVQTVPVAELTMLKPHTELTPELQEEVLLPGSNWPSPNGWYKTSPSL